MHNALRAIYCLFELKWCIEVLDQPIAIAFDHNTVLNMKTVYLDASMHTLQNEGHTSIQKYSFGNQVVMKKTQYSQSEPFTTTGN